MTIDVSVPLLMQGPAGKVLVVQYMQQQVYTDTLRGHSGLHKHM